MKIDGRNLTKIITFIVKALSSVSLLTGILAGLPEQYLWISAFVFAIASASKDILIVLGDLADDGKRNNSYTGN